MSKLQRTTHNDMEVRAIVSLGMRASFLLMTGAWVHVKRRKWRDTVGKATQVQIKAIASI